MNKKIGIIIGSLVIALLSVVIPTFFVSVNSPQYEATIHFIDPTEVTRINENGEETIPSRTPIFAGDTIRSTGIAEILLDDGNVVRIDENSEIHIQSFGNSEVPTHIDFISGNIWIHSVKNPIHVLTDRTQTKVANAVNALIKNESKTDIFTLQHSSYVDIQNESGETLNGIILPKYTKISVFENSINENYARLSSKKLRKQLKQQALSRTKLQDINWIADNILLDSQTEFVFFSDRENTQIPSQFLTTLRQHSQNIQDTLSISENKDIVNTVERLNNALLEAHALYANGYSQQEIILGMENFEKHYNTLKDLSPIDAKIFIEQTYNVYKHVSIVDTIFPLSQKITQLHKTHLQTNEEKQDFYISQAYGHMYSIEDILEQPTISALLLKDIQTSFTEILNEMNALSFSEKQLDDLRNTYFFLLIAKLENVNFSLLTINSQIENLHQKIAKQETPNTFLDIKYEIVENQLLLTDLIVERNRDFDLANLYLIDNKTFDAVEKVPENYAFREHLEEFAWLVNQKVINSIHSAATIDGKSFRDFIFLQRKIDRLGETLENTEDSTLTNDVSELEFLKKQSEIATEIQKIFAEKGLTILESNIYVLDESFNKVRIENLSYNNILIKSLHFDINKDLIYQVKRAESDKSIGIALPRENILKLFDDTQTDTEFFGNTIENITPPPNTKPETAVSRLLKEIIVREFEKRNIRIGFENITLLDDDGEQLEIRRVPFTFDETEIIVDFSYNREENQIFNIASVSGEIFQIEKTVPLEILPTTLEQKLTEIRTEQKAKNSIIAFFATKDIEISPSSFTFNDDEFDTINILNAQIPQYNTVISGNYNNTTGIFTEVFIDTSTKFENITIEELFENIKQAFLEKILENNGLEINDQTEFLPSISNPERVLIRDITFQDYNIRFIFNIDTQIISNIFLGNDIDLGISEIPLDQLQQNVEQKISEALEKQSEEEILEPDEQNSISEQQPSSQFLFESSILLDEDTNESIFQTPLGGPNDFLQELQNLQDLYEANL